MKKMKDVFLVLNSIALVIAISWYINSDYDYEPLIAIITLIITLLGLIFISTKSKSLKIKGKKNLTYQKDKDSSAEIDGDENITFQ
jgi:uncharacterized membrane protein